MTVPVIDIILEDPVKDDLRAIFATLDAYNDAHSCMVDRPGFAVLIRDPETNAAIVGLYATDGYGWAFIRIWRYLKSYAARGWSNTALFPEEAV